MQYVENLWDLCRRRAESQSDERGEQRSLISVSAGDCWAEVRAGGLPPRLTSLLLFSPIVSIYSSLIRLSQWL